MFNTLNQAIQKAKKDHPSFKVLVEADMNATIGTDSFGLWSFLGPNNDELTTNDNGTRLLNLSDENKLFILNSLFPSKAIHRHTWYSPNGFTKRVDYILADWHLKKLCSNCRVYRKATVPFETNHRLLAMSCSFPSKRNRKLIFSRPPKTPILPKNIPLLRSDPSICNKFSSKLDELLNVDPPCNNVSSLENFLTDAVLKASESEIPKFNKVVQKSPWTNDEFLALIEARNHCKDPRERKSLGISIKKMRNKLKNEYFSNLANNINIANEEQKIEEEFRFCKNYTMHKNSDTKLITNESLSEFFENHLKDKNIELQPEVMNPMDYPHILPPETNPPSSEIPTIAEVQLLRLSKTGNAKGRTKSMGKR